MEVPADQATSNLIPMAVFEVPKGKFRRAEYACRSSCGGLPRSMQNRSSLLAAIAIASSILPICCQRFVSWLRCSRLWGLTVSRSRRRWPISRVSENENLSSTKLGNGQSIIKGKYKLIRPKRSKPELYDLESDPAESRDLAASQRERVRELETLLLGERVDEPKGFAVTYHHWTGRTGTLASDPDHWSDYRYSNRGITYMSDSGSPKLSWIAKVENNGTQPSTVHVRQDLECLALAIAGNSSNTTATQTVRIDPGIVLLGRNEIRVTKNATLVMDESQLKSLRWVEVFEGGTLSGAGTIQSDVYHHGRIEIRGDGQAPLLSIQGTLNQSSTAQLSVPASASTPLRIEQDARLNGQLTIHGDTVKTTPLSVLTADRIVGVFSNANGEVVAAQWC